MSPILDSIGSVKAFGWGAIQSLTAYESISTVTVGSGGAANVEFTSIPATYTHLQIRGIARSGRSDAAYDIMTMRLNSDTGNNYNHHFLFGDGSSANAGTNQSGNESYIFALYYMSSSAGLSNNFGSFVIDILDYQNTNKFKTIRTLGGQNQNGGASMVGISSGLWRNTNAITSIRLATQTANNLQQYSQFALYGIKGA